MFDKNKRSAIMKSVKSSGNKSTELRLIAFFKANGITGWKRKYPVKGHPDFVFMEKRIAIFVDGEFWHGKDFVKTKEKLKNNRDYWLAKIEENIQRDIKNDNLLRQMEWIPIHFWSKDVIQYTELCIEEIQEIIYRMNDD